MTGFPRATVALIGALALSGCGSSEFAAMIEAECSADGSSNRDCACIAGALDEGLPDHLKQAFPALRWPLRPEPAMRDAVNGEILRSAGIDPADRMAMESARREFDDRMDILREQTIAQCGGQL
jgi:hypothetical protein